MGSIERVNDLCGCFESEYDGQYSPGEDGIQEDIQWGNIAFEGVYFKYEEHAPNIIRDLSFHVRSGEHVAIIGDNGAGKTTIARLILGLIMPTTGQVLVGGRKVQELPKPILRRKVAYVSGEPYIFNATLRENMQIAKSDLSDSRMVTVLESMGIQLTERLGLDTVLGEGGTALSSGQRQRLALARAILREPEVLILDEATSSIDNCFEEIIHNMITGNLSGCTVILITHRESALSNVVRKVSLSERAHSGTTN
ncbi:MAG: ATP-binding cassette domain-containing protein [Peptococcaceae bacterium]|nr:ATP-binding cassette domain-containing protein [Peptococcaceae bacterium]